MLRKKNLPYVRRISAMNSQTNLTKDEDSLRELFRSERKVSEQ